MKKYTIQERITARLTVTERRIIEYLLMNRPKEFKNSSDVIRVALNRFARIYLTKEEQAFVIRPHNTERKWTTNK